MAHTKVWRTRVGYNIRVCDMTTEHLLNTVRLMERATEKVLLNRVMAYCAWPEPHGEMAQMAMDNEIADLAESTTGDIWPIYDDMVDEMYDRYMNR